MHVNPVLILALIFFLVCLVSGLWYGKGTKTFEQFAVGDKKFTVPTLIATMVATNFSGNLILRDLEQFYTKGFYYGLAPIVALSFFFISYFMALRMGEFLKHLSIAESMGVLFGKSVRVITALSGILLLAGTLSCQINIIAKIIKLCCTIKGDTPMYIAVVVVLLYATFGGIKAVTFTDIIQFMTFTTLIPVLLYLVSRHISSDTSFVTLFTTHPNFDLRQVVGFTPEFSNTLWLVLLFAVPFLDPASMQRVYMAKNVWQVRSCFFYTGVIGTMMKVIVFCLAIALFLYDANLNPKELVEHILKMHDYVWLKGFVCIGILALSMSTADSDLHSASVLLTHDILTAFQWKPKNKLIVAHLSSVLIMLLALAMAFSEQDLLKQILRAVSFYLPIVNVPFVMAVFGFRPASRSVLLGMAAGALTVVAFKMDWITCFNKQYDIFPAMFMNLLFLMGSHYLLPKVPGTGWVGIKDKAPLNFERQGKTRKKSTYKQMILNINWTHYLNDLIPKRSSAFTALGVYGIITQCAQLELGRLHLTMSMMLMAISTYLVVYPTLREDRPKRYNDIVAYFYPLLIFILLFLCDSYRLPYHSYSNFVIRIFLTNIAVSLMLFPVRMVLAMVAMACITMYGINVYRGYPWEFIQLVATGRLPRLFYNLSVFSLFYVVIVAYKNEIQKYILKLIQLNKEKCIKQTTKLERLRYDYDMRRLTGNGNHQEVMLPRIAGELQAITQAHSLPEAVTQRITQLVDRLAGCRQFIAESRYNRVYHLPLQQRIISITAVIDQVIQRIELLDSKLKIVIDRQTTQDLICCDPIQLEQLLVELIQFMEESIDSLHTKGLVYLYIMETQIAYQINPLATENKTLPALAFVSTATPTPPAIAALYLEDLYHGDPNKIADLVPANSQSLLKRSMTRIVQAHYGCLLLGEEPPAVCILPVNLNEIRDEVMNNNPFSTTFTMAETTASLAQEKQLEALLVRETTLNSALIRETIQFIKRCHGHQRRASGEPYYTHPMAVATLLLQETKDAKAILAALLHDVIEDSKMSTSYIRSIYGGEVADIVATVTHMGHSFRKHKLNKKENEKHFKGFQDIRAVQVKLADRLHNVLTLKHRPLDKQIKVARETLDFYIPLATSLGVTQLTQMLTLRCQEIVDKVLPMADLDTELEVNGTCYRSGIAKPLLCHKRPERFCLSF
ncbi:MAG: HD domain-containing protein [Amoebophilaceae bacterium]|nr:HD domain-containing protein [Amoebophilaceae bacterium]